MSSANEGKTLATRSTQTGVFGAPFNLMRLIGIPLFPSRADDEAALFGVDARAAAELMLWREAPMPVAEISLIRW